jgi:presequence protease
VGKYNEIGLLSFYQFIADLERDIAGKAGEITANLHTVADLIFNKAGLLVSVTTGEDDYEPFRQSFCELLKSLGDKVVQPVTYQFSLSPQNEGLMTSSKVQYVVKGYNYKRLGYSYCGSLKVLETILRYDYLWNRVRVQGGAYGGFAQFDRTGHMICGSYRDPNLRETLNVYDKTADYLQQFHVSDREMTKYVIGTMSGVDAPLTSAMKGERATAYYVQKITREDIQKEREEMLATRQCDIRELATLVDDVMRQNYICVLGNEEKIKANKDCFNTLVDVFA